MKRAAAGAAAGGQAKKKVAAKGGGKPVQSVQLPPGEILTDFAKRKWKVGHPIGRGGFGEIYLAARDGDGSVNSDAGHVIKIEPHGNGPLFSEINFYLRAAKPEDIEQFKASRKLKHLGMPKYIAHGAHTFRGVAYRFMVMERFGEDLDKKIASCQGSFSWKTVCCLAIKVLDVLEYLHNRGYVHADLKGSNLLVGYHNEKEVALVDFGLVALYTIGGEHRKYKEDPKKAHDGTIEFTSRDAHRGVAPTRRGDVEILGYVLIRWLCRCLPWEDHLADKAYVAREKIKYMENPSALLNACFHSGGYPEELLKYLTSVNRLKYDSEPDYRTLRLLFQNALKKNGWTDDGKYDWNDGSGPSRKRRGIDEADVANPLKRPRTSSPGEKRHRKSPLVVSASPAKGLSPRQASEKPAAVWKASVEKNGHSPKFAPAVKRKVGLPKPPAASPGKPAKRKRVYSPASDKIPSASDIRGPPIRPKAARGKKR